MLIAPFWSEVFLYRGGNVFYRFTDDEYILNDIGMIIRDAFVNDFSPTLVFIATWDKVQALSYRVSRKQICCSTIILYHGLYLE